MCDWSSNNTRNSRKKPNLDIALIEILLNGGTLLTKSGDIIRTWLLTDDEPKKIEASKAEIKEEPKADKETIIEIDGIH